MRGRDAGCPNGGAIMRGGCTGVMRGGWTAAAARIGRGDWGACPNGGDDFCLGLSELD